MTEEEAKATQCCGPVLIAQAMILSARKDHQKDGFGFNCIGSKCMSWRWDHTERSPLGRPAREWPGAAPYVGDETLIKVHGYCGLAGPL